MPLASVADHNPPGQLSRVHIRNTVMTALGKKLKLFLFTSHICSSPFSFLPQQSRINFTVLSEHVAILPRRNCMPIKPSKEYTPNVMHKVAISGLTELNIASRSNLISLEPPFEMRRIGRSARRTRRVLSGASPEAPWSTLVMIMSRMEVVTIIRSSLLHDDEM